jgi:hypothetical protein
MAMMSAATVTTHVDQASVFGLRAVIKEPTKMALTATVHTVEMPRVGLRKSGLFHTRVWTGRLGRRTRRVGGHQHGLWMVGGVQRKCTHIHDIGRRG